MVSRMSLPTGAASYQQGHVRLSPGHVFLPRDGRLVMSKSTFDHYEPKNGRRLADPNQWMES